ncbi:MAG TPA: NUDIX domain-containing protein, partial [Acidimicrobiales bacterium]
MDLVAELERYVPRTPAESVDVARVRALAASDDPWSRTRPVHVTGSALVVHPPTGRVLLRWHERMGSWLHVGGHVDAGETGPLTAALREAREETGLADLSPWP